MSLKLESILNIKMKKISKCLLLVVSVVSLVCLVFYKTQYDKLYNVLQVLEFFGSEDVSDATKDAFKRANCPTSGSVGSSVFRPPSWKRLTGNAKSPSSDVLIYSAFCSKNFDSAEACPVVKIVALAPKDFDRNGVLCNLWYDDTLRPVLAIFSAEMLKEEGALGSSQTSGSSLVPFLFSCESKFSKLQPFGVSISFAGSKADVYAPVEPNSSPKSESSEMTLSACIRPQATRTDSSRQILENVLLHRMFGVTEFYLYDSGLTTTFVDVLNRIDDRMIRLKILPWNLPSEMISESAAKILVQTDCYWRTMPSASSTIVVEPHQILTPTSGSIIEVIKRPQMEGKLEVEVLKFCPEFESKKGHKLVSQQLTIFSRKLSSESPKFSFTYKLGPNSDVVSVPVTLMSLHDYGHCSLDDLSPDQSDQVDDLTISKMSHVIDPNIGKFFT